jgi:hypothetical protein
VHYALCKAGYIYMCVYFVCRRALYSIFFFILPRAGSGETGTRQMLSDSTRGSRGWFFGVCAVNTHCRCRAGGQVVAKRVLQLPPRGQWVFVVMSELVNTLQHSTPYVYVCSGHYCSPLGKRGAANTR